MRNNNNYKRSRSRNQSRRGNNSSSNGRNGSFDSSGPEIRVRGSAVQVNEKYMALGNDAYLSGDRIQAEAYFQHAEHYYRVFIASNGGVDPRKNPVENNDKSKIQKDEESVDEKSKNGSDVKNDENKLNSQHSHEEIEILSTNQKNENTSLDSTADKQIDAV